MHSDVLSAEEDRYASSEAIKEPTSLNENCSKPLPSLTRLRSRRNYIDIIAIGLTSSSTYPLQAIWVAHGKDIRSVRNILSAILQKNGTQLNDESLNTLCETEAIVNSRPLTTTTMSPADSVESLMPNHLLTMKTRVLLPPPGVFQSADQYSHKRWRRVQHLSNEFWIRWRKEFLHSLQQRQSGSAQNEMWKSVIL